MKRHRSLIPLSHDHQQGLFLARVLKKKKSRFKSVPRQPEAKVPFAQSYFRRVLAPHFELEESVLLPEVSGIREDLDRLLQEMLEDHRRIREMFASLEDSTELEEDLHQLGEALEAHIRKEERQLFQGIQQAFSEGRLEQLGARLEAVERISRAQRDSARRDLEGGEKG